MKNKDTHKKPLTQTKEDDENKKTIERGKAASKAQYDLDKKPTEIKNKEAEKDAEKWRNEG